MFNKSGITKTTGAAPVQILLFPGKEISLGVVVDDAIVAVADANGKKIAKAGTPLYGNLDAPATPFVAPSNSGANTKGVYTVQITTAATAGDIITIENVDYTHGAAENVGNKVFAGATAADQITSLLKMVVCDDFTVAAVDGATDKLGFTQKVADTGDVPVVTATKIGGGAIVIGKVVTVTKAVEGIVVSNAVGILLHDVDVTAGNANGTLVIDGYVNLSRIDTTTKALLTAEVKAALRKITFLTR